MSRRKKRSGITHIISSFDTNILHSPTKCGFLSTVPFGTLKRFVTSYWQVRCVSQYGARQEILSGIARLHRLRRAAKVMDGCARCSTWNHGFY